MPGPTAMPTGTGPVGMPTGTPTSTPTSVPTSVPTTAPTTDPPAPTVVCGDTKGKWQGDQYCILPPAPDQGFQLHVGPTDYDDPAQIAKYTLKPGGEDNVYIPVTSGNTKDVFYYKRQYRMRPGSHHLIVSEGGGTNPFAGGRRLGGSQNVSRDNPEGTPPAENQGIGIPLKANDPISLNLHHFNGGDEPLLEEAWVNFWYVDPASVTQQANELYLFAPGSSVAPHGSATFSGKKSITAAGRILSMYGHRHASTTRFTAYRTRGGQRAVIYQDYNWEEPAVFEFNSVAKNPPADPSTKAAGAFSGDLDLKPGDVLEWECEVHNPLNQTLTYGANEALDSEMCILIGDVIGPALIGFFTTT
jgi:hypothetical protein